MIPIPFRSPVAPKASRSMPTSQFQPLYRPVNVPVVGPVAMPISPAGQAIRPAGQTLPSGSDFLVIALVAAGLGFFIWANLDEEKRLAQKRAQFSTRRNPHRSRHPKFDPPGWHYV